MIEVYHFRGYIEDLVYIKNGQFKFIHDRHNEWTNDLEPYIQDLKENYIKLFELYD